eukprot:scaffold20480_cov30-Tisochrysis_lutea.AAC.3
MERASLPPPPPPVSPPPRRQIGPWAGGSKSVVGGCVGLGLGACCTLIEGSGWCFLVRVSIMLFSHSSSLRSTWSKGPLRGSASASARALAPSS